jgi:hypothetical protein
MDLTWADVLKELYREIEVSDRIAQRHPDVAAANDALALLVSIVDHLEEELNVQQEGTTNGSGTETPTSTDTIATRGQRCARDGEA